MPEWESLPFDEAIAFFKQKLNISTRRWTDLWKKMHDRGFMVAGAMKEDLLADLRAAIEKALVEGTTLETFRKEFDGMVEKYGWKYVGGRAWRTDIILNTNIRTAYSAGRYKQMIDPELLESRPLWEYRHGDSRVPRPLHLSWHGLILPADDPWWKTHYPPNGWGCKCKVFALGERALEKTGKSGSDQAPDNGTYEWIDKKTGEVHTIPKGIDPGWDYLPGETWAQ